MPSRPVPNPAALRVKGQRSLETLSHFQCGACSKWWSIGDAPRRPRWFCPWCGEENSFPKPRAKVV